MKYLYKSIKFLPEKWETIKTLADDLSEERGTNVSLPDAVIEAVKMMIDTRHAEKEASNAGEN